MTFDADSLNEVLDFNELKSTHPTLFSRTSLTIPHAVQNQVISLIGAIESVVAMPAYQALALARAPAIASSAVSQLGVFMGYDFHLCADGPQLIEINTNAGGALLNTRLLAAHGRREAGEHLEQAFLKMFQHEWQLARGNQPLRRIAIVDEQPATQYLAPEFNLFKNLFAVAGIDAVIADPSELEQIGQSLCYRGEVIDLVYNRLTDFALSDPGNAHLRSVYEAGGIVLTPHPRAHAMYADKRNLCLLSDPQWLSDNGVPEETCSILLQGIPRTIPVLASDRDRFWSERKSWFFKPAAGFGSRAAYRGDKLTRRVFDEILEGDYIAQKIAPPAEIRVDVDETTALMKYDLRAYVYGGALQMLAARLYQGQTTNFRTPGGGFAPVFVERAQ